MEPISHHEGARGGADADHLEKKTMEPISSRVGGGDDADHLERKTMEPIPSREVGGDDADHLENKTMEPISSREGGGDDADHLSRRSGKFTDADLDKLQLGLSELEKVMSAGDSINLVESFLADHSHINNDNNHSLAPQTQWHFTARQILDDFDEFETKMLPPNPSSSLCSQQRDNVVAANHSSNSTRTATAAAATYEDQILGREIKESRVMIDEMPDDDYHHLHPGSTFDLGNSNDCNEDVNIDITFDDDYVCLTNIAGINPFFGQAYNFSSGGGSSRLELEGDYFRGGPTTSMTFSAGPPPLVRYFICSRNSDGSGFQNANTRPKKRKSKGGVETEGEIARRIERTKIKNREAAAKAHQRKQAYEAHLQTLLLKLRKKNEFLKNMVMFLQGHQRADVHPQPLRRTISGPM